MNVENFSAAFHAIHQEVCRAVVGQEEIIEHLLVSTFAGGHVLLEGVPGLGKTLLVRTLATVLGVEGKRIQFTPDLMPTDVTGGNVYNQSQGKFTFMPGPVFANLVLADEINRAPAKTQSALLEAMQEHSVTADGVTRHLPQPFLVLATQNPVESQGTYPLPEAQLDRFLFKLEIHHPSEEGERRILMNHLQGFRARSMESFGLRRMASAEQLAAMGESVRSVKVDDEIVAYITRIVAATRRHRSVYLGASPRASLGLLEGARVRAASTGRSFVIPDDVKELAPAVLRHRLLLHPDAELEGVTPDDCVGDVLNSVDVPKTIA